MPQRDLARRNAVLDFMGDRLVHYSEVATFVGIDPASANQLMRFMESERLLTKVRTGTWRATGRKPEPATPGKRRAVPIGWPEVPELARVW